MIDQSIERDGIDAPKYEEDSVLQIKTPLGEFIKLPKDESPEESCNAVKEASKQDEQRKKKQKKSTSGSSNLTVIHKRLYSATQEGKSRVHSLKEKLRKQPIASRSLREVSEKVKKKRVLKSLVSVSSK
ncbi:hypothetical protein EON65_29715 [archaeon]|nr:MAG: hypothetical protein EON65_29715 [archaeon]